MAKSGSSNAVVAQSGGPTAVINQSVVGVVEGLRAGGFRGQVLGARHGVRGMVEGKFADLTGVPGATLDAVAGTPSAALGSTRDKPDREYCVRILESLRRHAVTHFFYIGGNDSSDTCRIVNEAARAAGDDIRCFHVPKTIDNDLMESDHTPGFPSAARYVAKMFLGDGLDNRALPGIKVNIVMGRHAGFLTAAAALARVREDDGPHLVYVPEVAFDIDAFIGQVDRVYSKLGRCQIAVSEGVQDAKGESIGAKLIKGGEADAHGNVQLSGSGALGDQLAELLKQKLKAVGGKAPRVRADTLGYAQRCYPDASPVDQREAREAGRFAAQVALGDEHRDGSVAIVRNAGATYSSSMKRVNLSDVAAKTRHLDGPMLGGFGEVTQAYLTWLKPLVGEMPVVGWFA